MANIRDNRVSQRDADESAKTVGAAGRVDPKQLRKGMAVELEHQRDPETNVAKGDPKAVARIAWAHLKESPRYYQELDKMESKLEKKGDETGATSPQETTFGVFSPRAAALLSQPRVTNRFRAAGFAEEAAGVAGGNDVEVG